MANPYISLLKAVWHYGKSYRWAMVGMYIAYIIAQSFMSLSPYALGKTIDVLQHFSPDRLNEVIGWLSVIVVVILLFWLFHGPTRVFERIMALKIQQSFRLQIYEQLTHLPLKWHQDHHSGNIISRLNRSATALHRFGENQFIYIEAFVRYITSIGFLCWISWPVGLITLFASLVIGLCVILFDKKLIPLYDAQNEIENHIGGVLFDYISNITTIITLRLSALTHHNLFQRMMTIWPYFRKDAKINEWKWFMIMFLLNLLQAIVLIGYIMYSLHATGAILIGAVVMIYRYQTELSYVFFELSTQYSELVRADTDVKGINTILDDIERLAHLPQGATTAVQWHQLTISNLSFRHDEMREQGHALKQIALSIRRGEKIALIGQSGGGKSTLLNLLCGLYMPDTVQLDMDGVIFNNLEPLQAITTLIPQEPEIFENTIAFNITMDLETSPDEIAQSTALACFTPVLETLPQGLATDIREKGLNLSVGQKQRLALSRGLFAARFSSLILMDEPTSSVDLPTETKILSGIIAAFPESALVVSLHRLHLLPRFDRVILLDNGVIVADGDARTLLNQAGPVKDLWLKYQE